MSSDIDPRTIEEKAKGNGQKKGTANFKRKHPARTNRAKRTLKKRKMSFKEKG